MVGVSILRNSLKILSLTVIGTPFSLSAPTLGAGHPDRPTNRAAGPLNPLFRSAQSITLRAKLLGIGMGQVAALAHPEVGALRLPLIEKLGRFVDLGARERDYLLRMQGDFSRIRSGADVITAGHTYHSVFVLSR